jgi:hypothetical protein
MRIRIRARRGWRNFDRRDARVIFNSVVPAKAGIHLALARCARIGEQDQNGSRLPPGRRASGGGDHGLDMLAAREFLLIMGLGLIVAGLTAYVIVWMLVAVHLREHHPAMRTAIGNVLVAPRALVWYLGAQWRKARDANLNVLAFPGTVGVWGILAGIVGCAISEILAVIGGTR